MISSTRRDRLATLQAHLYRTASDGVRRPFRVDNALRWTETYGAAFHRTARARGQNTPGVDGITLGVVREAIGVPIFVGTVSTAVTGGRYKPSGARRVTIPKPGGGERTLSIVTLGDRVVAHALLQLVEPVVEGLMLPVSYASRPGRGPQNAIAGLSQALLAENGDEYHVLRADLEKYFDRVTHDLLRGQLRKYIHGPLFYSLFDQQLEAWESEPGRGLAQGAPTSPALANLFLLEVDRYFFNSLGLRYIRYMDDIAIVVPGRREEAEAVLAELQEQLALLGLGLNNKTRILNKEDIIHFLGVDIERTPEGILTSIPDEVIQEKIQAIDATVRNRSTEERQELHQAIQAWTAYTIRYDAVAVKLVTKYFEGKIGWRITRKSGTTIVKTKYPKWMVPKRTTTKNMPKTGPRPVEQSHLGPGPRSHPAMRGPLQCLRDAEGPPELPQDMGELNNVDLGELYNEYFAFKQFAGARLNEVQQDIWRSGIERRRYRTDLNSVTSAADAALARDPEYQRMLETEHVLRREAGQLKQLVMKTRGGIERIWQEMELRARARGLQPVRGRVHQIRVHKARRLSFAPRAVSARDFG